MKLSDYEFFPGVVTKVDDPKCIGRIKCTVPTVFDASMDVEGLPWIYPFTMTGNQSFSKLREGNKVWVFRNTTNHNEFWYIPMFEMTEETKQLMGDDNYEDSEVIMSRSNGGNSVFIYYNEADGIMIKYGDTNLININPDSEITIQAGDGKVVVKDNQVYIGDGGDGERAVLGETLQKILNKFFSGIAKLATPATAPPMHGTSIYAANVAKIASEAAGKLDTMLCSKTNVD